MVFRTLSQSLTSKSSLLLDDDFDSPRRQRSNSTTKLKKNRRSGYTSIGEHEASDNFNDFDGDHCNKKDNKLIIMNQQNVQEPSARQSTKTGFPEPFCGGKSSNTLKAIRMRTDYICRSKYNPSSSTGNNRSKCGHNS